MATAIIIILTSVLLVIKEVNKGLKGWFAGLSGHHWTTHGVLTILAFVILGLLLSQIRLEEKWDAKKLAVVILTATILGGLIVTIFFLVH
ncbi:MAG: hypothetical protein C4567_00600 [Deltaproteobacteria bacterium]|nr:MAG: hypothetical protein C4567_00600 [Deltaproteobacteria bacterium]